MTAQTDDELWSAIADPSRRLVLDLLVSNDAVSASWLAGQVPFSRQAVSKHLAVLERAGLISRRKQGREVVYQVQAARVDEAARAVAGLAAQWEPARCPGPAARSACSTPSKAAGSWSPTTSCGTTATRQPSSAKAAPGSPPRSPS